MRVNTDKTLATYTKSKPGAGFIGRKKQLPSWKVLATLMGVLFFVVGSISVVLITRQQDTTPVAPTAPTSEPAAFIEKLKSCTVAFDILEEEPPITESLSCGQGICLLDSDCEDSFVCALTDRNINDRCEELGGEISSGGGSCLGLNDNEANRAFCAQITSIVVDAENNLINCMFSGGINTSNNFGYCSDSRYTTACVPQPSYSNCCTAPNEVELLVCGEQGCSVDDDCENSLVCVDGEGGSGYCAEAAYQNACSNNPSQASCCTPPTVTTQPPTVTTQPPTVTTQPPTVTTQPPTVTTQPPTTTTTVTQPPAQITTVVTTVNCNDTCVANADCRNISHICYEGRCRLDVNPTDAQCRLPSGETTITRPVVVPTESGPTDWLNYLKAGLGVLGIGALLMLLL
jgi:hypothetical protein